MQYYYGDYNLLRLLDEADFWKQQEQEHTVVIEQIVPDLEQNYVNRLRDYGRLFGQTHGNVTQLAETVIRLKGMYSPELHQQVLSMIHYCMNESQDFINFLNDMMARSSALQGNVVANVVINHIIRESEYFTGISQTILYR